MLASYNWIKGPNAKIVVPGMLWTPPKVVGKLNPNNGIFYRDRNAAADPKHPMEPTVVAVMKMQPAGLRLYVVACSHTLLALLGYVLEEDTALRMVVEVVGETVRLIRRENPPTEQLARVRGYGHSFPDAYTTLDAGLESAPRGHVVLEDNVFDIKTRSIYTNEDTLTNQFPVLWLNQISNFILGRHQVGRFNKDVLVENVRGKTETWERENEAVVNKLVGLLGYIIEIAMRHEATKLELTRQEEGDLEIRTRLPDAGDAFSRAVRAQWEDWLQEGRDEESEGEEGGDWYASSDDDDKDSYGWSDDDEYLTHCTEECGYCG
ncbi:hypothetical protein CDD82_4492 [Ophiocordyceps australis]|uniref:Uncharacterized protein n=1 Tax=Ophiocordyceps australis TaxID=1399860 RepID=A0A2C5XK95_9HYPO|nr:hypothetical protein CDD82_4492 [Ophiocordyceps australis]